MQKKYFNFQPKGMNTNMSPKFQSNEYATYMNNIRITKDDNGILSLKFEKGINIIYGKKWYFKESRLYRVCSTRTVVFCFYCNRSVYET